MPVEISLTLLMWGKYLGPLLGGLIGWLSPVVEEKVISDLALAIAPSLLRTGISKRCTLRKG